MAQTPTIKVGGEILWLDQEALAKGRFKLESDSVSEYCDGCGRDIVKTGNIVRGAEDDAVHCTECGDFYPIVIRDVI